MSSLVGTPSPNKSLKRTRNIDKKRLRKTSSSSDEDVQQIRETLYSSQSRRSVTPFSTHGTIATQESPTRVTAQLPTSMAGDFPLPQRLTDNIVSPGRNKSHKQLNTYERLKNARELSIEEEAKVIDREYARRIELLLEERKHSLCKLKEIYTDIPVDKGGSKYTRGTSSSLFTYGGNSKHRWGKKEEEQT